MKKEVYHLTWYMRGGVTSHELLYDTDIGDFDILNTIIKENIESTKKSGLALI